ncbi:MAG: hypothetical protein SH819_01800 [Cytophagales bacterium]|nr:hypothetical protein [Cytophagales bacterium]
MPSIIQGYECDIFISYRHNDNRSGWVTEFVKALQEELAATIKEPVSVYFDTNPHDGLLETHHVAKSLEGKLKCLILIPIISQTYCDSKSFAWENEFLMFNKMSKEDKFGRDIRVDSGNVVSRILPIKIHDLDAGDLVLLENELEGALRSIEFIYRTAGVNRPLTPSDNPEKNLNKTFYRDQINKVANGVKEILMGLKNFENPVIVPKPTPRPEQLPNFLSRLNYKFIFFVVGFALIAGYYISNFVKMINLSNQEQYPIHKLILPAFLIAIVAIVARMPVRKMGYTILQIVAIAVFCDGLMLLIFTFSSTSLPNAHIKYLQLGAEEVSRNLMRLDFALLRALGTTLMAVGIGAWVLLHGPVRQGNKSAMIGLVVMITLTEGNNSLQMYILDSPFFIYTLTLVLLTWTGAPLWWRGDPHSSGGKLTHE